MSSSATEPDGTDWATRSFLDGTEPGRSGVLELCARALELRDGAAPSRFPGARVAAVFLNPSLRTRTSLEAACALLGAHPITLSPGTDSWALELADGVTMDGVAVEHVRDAIPVLSSYCDVLALRAFAGLRDLTVDRSEPALSAFVRHSRVPVVNLESARFHPLQGLADTATWMGHLGDLRGRRLTLTWAPHPRSLPQAVGHQVLMSAALQGMEVTVAHPDGFDLDPEIVRRADGLAAAAGGAVRVVHDQAEGLAGADVVVAKSWAGTAGYGRRDAEAAVRATLSGWQVTPERMAVTSGAGFMHCLPVRRNVVVSDAVIDGPRSWVQEEAALRLWTVLALLERMLGARR